MGFFFAFMMFGREAKRGSLRRRSVVNTAGIFRETVSRPPSISRVSSSASPSLDHGLEYLGYRQRFHLGVRLHQDPPVGAHGERGANGLLALFHTDGDGDYLGCRARFPESKGLFDGNLVEGIHGHLYVRRLDTAAVRLDADFDVVVDDSFDCDEYLHDFVLSRLFLPVSGSAQVNTTAPRSQSFEGAPCPSCAAR
jgi:hypothetical protein